MSEMIERVAKALFSGSVYHGYNKETLDAEWFRTKGIHMAQAKAAIEAMREPTEDMRWAGYTREAFAPESTNVSSIQFDAKPIWHRMIDEALK